MQVIYSLLLSIDGIVYDFVCYLYEIFEFLAKINIFGEENYNSIVNRIYIILGLIMLFALAYSLLKAVINPDSFAKGESSFPKLIQNVVVSLIIIAVLPTVFTVAFNIQNSVLNQDTIPKIILGEEEFSSIENTNPGKSMAYYTFTAFFHENEEWCQNKNNNYNPYDGSTTCSDEIKGNGWVFFQNGDSLTKITKDVLGTEERPQGYSFVNFNQFSEAVHNGQISYMMIVSTVAGIFLAYVLLNFCFNMATRVIKLMYFQLIAPIPVICRVIPGGKLKDVFSDWTKKTLSTFLEVFIHIGVMYLGVFMINVIIANLGSIGFTPVLVNNLALPSAINWGGLGLSQRLIVRALLIMGVVTFIKQAPKLICDMFHLDSGSMKLGLMDKLAMGGGLLAAGAFGGGVTTLGKNMVSQFGNKKNWQNAKGKVTAGSVAKNLGYGLLSGAAGGLSGAARSGYGAKGAKNIKDMNAAIAKGSTAATTAKAKREAYRASHRGHGMLDTALNVGIGHVSDAVGGVAQYFGYNNVQSLIEDNKNIDNINAKKKALRNAAEDLIIGESNKQGVQKTFGLTGTANVNGRTIAYNTAILRTMRQTMEAAKAAGAANAGQLQDEYDSYLKQFTDAVQNQALLGTTGFNNLLSGMSDSDARSLQADLGDVRNAASDYRRILKDNLTASYVANSGFTADMLKDDNDLNLKTPALDALGDNLKIAKSENIRTINELQQKASQNQDSN